jgi:hypothetical protein
LHFPRFLFLRAKSDYFISPAFDSATSYTV